MSDIAEPSPESNGWMAKLANWLDRVDRWSEHLGDSFNPILVKETRQALKSRQFVITFSVLLFAALAWTIIGSLSLMPRIYSTPSAPRLLIGYYIVLAIPMLLVVPLAAYRSLEGEIDDGTLELLSITTLSPWQIVLGKLASAMLQMLLYFVALFPCVAYAYTLRGVDLPTTLLIVATLLVAGIVLTIVALFFAPLALTRTGRIATLLVVMLILIGAEWGLGAMLVGMIMYGNPLSTVWLFFIVTATVIMSISVGHLLLTATAAQLTPESENRSTHLRISMLILSAVVMALIALAIQTLGQEGAGVASFGAIGLAGLWALAGSMMAAESPRMTPRIRRELPSSFASRMLLTWLTPGPVTGLVFASANIVVLTVFILFGIDYIFEQPNFRAPGGSQQMLRRLCIAYSSYLIGFLVAVRFIIGVIRIKNHPRAELGLAALIAVAVLTALIPYSIGLHWNDYLPYSYSPWQITNWAWTLSEIASGRAFDSTVLVIAVA
ncbi:MAG: ABC transporter permease, partial [Rubripirellula sp.]